MDTIATPDRTDPDCLDSTGDFCCFLFSAAPCGDRATLGGTSLRKALGA